MAKFSVRRHSDPFYVLALKEAIVKISAQKQCPNEGRIVRSVLQEFDWSKVEIVKQLKFAVKDGLILQVTTSSSHGSTKGIPQTAYRILRKDGEDDVSSFVREFSLHDLQHAQVSRAGSDVLATPWTASNCLCIVSLLKRGRFVYLADL